MLWERCGRGAHHTHTHTTRASRGRGPPGPVLQWSTRSICRLETKISPNLFATGGRGKACEMRAEHSRPGLGEPITRPCSRCDLV